MPMKCMDQIASPNVMPPAVIQTHAERPLHSRMRWAWVSAVNEPIIATSTDNTTSEISQVISTTLTPFMYSFNYEPTL